MATNNYMPMGRNPRSGGAGQAASYKKGGATTKVAGVMKSGGAKYQDKGAVTATKKGAVEAAKAAANAIKNQKKPLMNPSKIAVPGSFKPPISNKTLKEYLESTQNESGKLKGVVMPYELKSGGAKYQSKGAVKSNMVKV